MGAARAFGAMRRLWWLSAFCLVAIDGLFAMRGLRADVSAPGNRSAPAALAADFSDLAEPALAKSDRLPINSVKIDRPASTLKEEPVKPVRAAPVSAAQQAQAADDIVSWHWHEGAKVVRRRAH
jgi:hypothetical protein